MRSASLLACALLVACFSNDLLCWWSNPNFVLGGAGDPEMTPTLVDSTKTWVGISGGASHSCGFDAAGAAWCWGANEYGQVGDGSSYEPSPVVSGVYP